MVPNIYCPSPDLGSMSLPGRKLLMTTNDGEGQQPDANTPAVPRFMVVEE